MGYKQSPFPMHKGTSSHTSALKQITDLRSANELDATVEDVSKKVIKGLSKKERKEIKKAKKDQIKSTPEEQQGIHVQTKKEAREARSREKNPKRWELKDERKKGRAARKEERHQAKLERAGESIEERKARKMKRNEELKKTLNPIFKAMDEPISRQAKGYFPKHEGKKGKSKYKKKYKKSEEKVEGLKKQIKDLTNEYENAKSDDYNKSNIKLKKGNEKGLKGLTLTNEEFKKKYPSIYK